MKTTRRRASRPRGRPTRPRPGGMTVRAAAARPAPGRPPRPRRPSRSAGHLARGRVVEAVVLLVVLDAGRSPSRSRRSGRRRPRRSRRPRSRVALLELEVAGGFELHGLVVESASESRASTSKSVSSKMSFSPLRGPGRRGAAGERGLLPRRAWRLAGAWRGIGLDRRRSSGASSIESAAPRSSPEAICRLMPESLGRERLIPERPRVGRRHVGVARLGQRGRLEFVAAFQGAELEVAAGVGLQGVDHARRGELEVAVGLARPAGISADDPEQRARSHGRVARARTRGRSCCDGSRRR